jgi:capsid protein
VAVARLAWRSATPARSPRTGVHPERTARQEPRSGAPQCLGAAGIEAFVANAIGTGIKPQSMVADEALREAIQALWRDWCEEADAAGLTDFYGLQALACRAMLEGGECLVRLRYRRPEDGLAVPLQLQLLEPEHLPPR